MNQLIYRVRGTYCCKRCKRWVKAEWSSGNTGQGVEK